MRKKFLFGLFFVFLTSIALTFISHSQKINSDTRYAGNDSIRQGLNAPRVVPDSVYVGNCCYGKDSCLQKCCRYGCREKCKRLYDVNETKENNEVPVGRNPHLNDTDTTGQKVPPPQEVK